MTIATLNATARKGAGKGAARAVRREGLIPAVIYGDKKPPVLISISQRDLLAETNKKGFWTRQYEIEVEGEKYRGICQDIQLHPVTDAILHVDFLRISKDSEIFIEVPVSFINRETCPGIKLGGNLNVVSRTVEVVCRPDDIPSKFEIDLAGLNFNDSVHASDLEMPKGVKLADSSDYTIASINPPAGKKAAAEEETATEEATAEEEK
jgi:large subunit ribosomal protein L25